MTNIIDIYEAAGAKVNENRTSVELKPPLKPFEIILLVVPEQIEMDGFGMEKITFTVLLDDEVRFGKTTPLGTPIERYYHETEVTLPVSQVRILKENQMTDLSVTDSPKMLRETLCVAQSRVANNGTDLRVVEHVNRLQRLIDECDRHRPLGPDGKHGNLHTPTCGCENND